MTVLQLGSAAGARGFAQFRDTATGAAEIKLPGPADDFRMRSATLLLGSAVLVDLTITPVIFEHSAALVARTGVDHLMLTMYLAGECAFTAGRRAIRARPGDIFVVDYSEPNFSRSSSVDGSTHVVNLILPRSRLAPLLAAPNAVQGALILRETTAGRLVCEHMLALNDAAARLTPSEIEYRLTQLTHLVAQSLGPADAEDPGVARQALLSSIKRHVEQQLIMPGIGVDYLCDRFGLSRSALYRLFEPEGGLAAYIQQRRLIRAYARLAAPEIRHRRIIDIALESQFASDATFARAFRREFGVTPREVRARRRTGRPGATLARRASVMSTASKSGSSRKHGTRSP
jgi:AraC-like DNA-binding protein